MGAWDETAFGNDDASDMVLDLLEHSNPRDYVTQILARSREAGYLEAPDGSRIVAAAAIVAASRSQGSTSIPGTAANWIQANESMLRPLAEMALEALARVRGENSELCELWQGSNSFQAWISELDTISAALR